MEMGEGEREIAEKREGDRGKERGGVMKLAKKRR